MSVEPGGGRSEASRRDEPLLEAVVTTADSDGDLNCAAMGVRWGERELVFWPFDATRTLRNLRMRGEAVVHLTDDVLLFVQSALGHPQPPTRPADHVRGAIIEAADVWREIVVDEIAPAPIADGTARSRVLARVVGGGSTPRETGGLCRARHAVVEASILASRLRHLDRERVLAELHRLQDLVDRTGGGRERAAMDYVHAHIARRA